MSQSADPLLTAPLRSLMGVQIAATGSYVPEIVVTNEDLQARLGFDPAWIEQRSGIHQRRHAPAGMATSDLAVIAAQRALDRLGARPADVDLLLVGTFTPDMSFPSTACLVQDRLGLRCGAVDLQAACAGFLYALLTGAQFVAAGTSRLALVIGADCNSRIVNPRDVRTYPLFGDGAGAVLLAPGEPDQGLLAYCLGSDGSGGPMLQRRSGGSRLPFQPEHVEHGWQYMEMDGRAVFKWAVRLLEQSVDDVLRHAGLRADQLSLIALHQANKRIIDAAAESLGLDPQRVLVNLDRYGNTSGGSVPLALDEAWEAGRIHRGDNLLLSGFGAGLAWGTAIWKW